MLRRVLLRRVNQVKYLSLRLMLKMMINPMILMSTLHFLKFFLEERGEPRKEITLMLRKNARDELRTKRRHEPVAT